MNRPIVECRALSQTFDQKSYVLKNVSFTIMEGKKIAILGHNGAGKSTLLLHLNGILRPTSGEVLYQSKPLHYRRVEMRELRKKVGLVMQNPDSQVVSTMVEEDIMFGLKNLGLNQQEIDKKTEQMMVLAGIGDLRGKPTHLLSQGQKKKVALAGVLIMEPEILLLDEPTAQLDPGYTSLIIELLQTLHQDKTTILTTHDVDFAYEWADEIMILHEGMLVYYGKPYHAFQQDDLLFMSQLKKPWLVELYDRYVKPFGEETPPTNKADLYEILDARFQNKTTFSMKKRVGGYV